MNKRYFNFLMKRLDFNKDEITYLSDNFEILKSKKSLIDNLINEYKNNINIDFNYLIDSLTPLSNELNINKYTIDLIFLILLSYELRNYYIVNKISLNVFYDTIYDLKYKLDECILIKGVIGNFVSYWYKGFFNLIRFKLGRLEYDIKRFDRTYSIDNKNINNGDYILNIHIPRTGERLSKELVFDSFKQASIFFKDYFKDNYIPFICHSWILYPKMINEVYDKNSNLYYFSKLFKIIEEETYDKYYDLWRIYDKEYNESEFYKLKEDSSLRRNLKDYILNKNKMGNALGIYLYNKETE